ncbi:CHAD domain-containing protein [Soehngenia saccharolytica]|nr:CHAD domain-containing protein [Soehngenia saccharolytica]
MTNYCFMYIKKGIYILYSGVFNMKTSKLLKSKYEKIVENYADIENMLYDENFIHELRVNIRELRSMLYFFKPIAKKKKYNALNDFLNNLSGQFSKLREIQIAKQIYKDYCGVKTIDYPNIFSDILVKVEEAIVSDLKRVLVPREEFENNNKILYQVIKEIENYEDIEKFVKKRITKMSKDIANQIDNINLSDLDDIHRLRISLKRLKYALKYLPFPLEKYSHISEKVANDLSDSLGVMLDKYATLSIFSSYSNAFVNSSISYHRGLFEGYLYNEIDLNKEEFKNKIGLLQSQIGGI